MDSKTLMLTVSAGSSAQTSELTGLLMQRLQSDVEDIEVKREKAEKGTLDMGATLIAVIATPFALQLAKTLHAWVMKNNSATVIVGKRGVKIQANGVSREDVVEIVKEALAQSEKE